MCRVSLPLLLLALLPGCASGRGSADGGHSNRPDLGPPHDGGPTMDDASHAPDGMLPDPDAATAPDDGTPPVDAYVPPVDAGDPCAACDPAAACDTRMGLRCVCPSGYTDVHGDGSLCTPPSACATATCDPHATCTPTAGSPGYTCTCTTGWMGSGMTCSDVDECAAGTAGCSPFAVCTNVPGSVACTCNPGFTGDGHTCMDVDECASGAAGCSPFATCTNTPGGYTCACGPGYTGDGRTCTMVVAAAHVLVFDDTSATLAGAAATSLGMTPTVTVDGPSFDTAFDAGGFTILVIDSGYEYLPADVQTRIGTWLTGGGRCVFAYWSLDTLPSLAMQLSVSLGGSFTTPRSVYADAASPAPLFSTTSSPITFTDTLFDDGDVVTPIGGSTAGDFDFPGGQAAIAITSANKVIVNGFSPFEANTTDGDRDGIPDSQEIWATELTWVAAH